MSGFNNPFQRPVLQGRQVSSPSKITHRPEILIFPFILQWKTHNEISSKLFQCIIKYFLSVPPKIVKNSSSSHFSKCCNIAATSGSYNDFIHLVFMEFYMENNNVVPKWLFPCRSRSEENCLNADLFSCFYFTQNPFTS